MAANELTQALDLARSAQQRGRYNASSDDGAVSIELDGSFEPRQVTLDAKALGVDAKTAERIAADVQEAMAAAVDKGRRKARKRLEEALARREVAPAERA